MLLAALALIVGLIVLVWSADRFIDGASATALHLGVPSLLIGMLIIGFGTSAPELMVSALSALQGNPSLALGNAYGSNIANIGLVIGLVAVLSPITVHSQIVRKELPILLGITLLSGALLLNGQLDRLDAGLLLLVFFALFAWSIVQGIKGRDDVLIGEIDSSLQAHPMPMGKAIAWLVIGLLLLVASSRLLVWGAVDIATALGVSELVIGLTIVAIGTSLPELAAAIAAVRKNEHDLVLGNIIGSGLFNTLAVVGLAAAISPLSVEPALLQRDWVLMLVLTVALLVFALSRRGRGGRINRVEGGCLLLVYLGYLGWLGMHLAG
ncbi:calcium/sodium antiporter [Halopseudomonas salegens]|uniref:Cation:H+ antiporter n=1 Tax=Halopseudomonas salegens TaxID=1434072 RepID=A0A1H2HHU4_9GAMM|nr:calcium/sodium antiporter [Halopseudomonas salegens]SDU31356.1 cation:H+ antiporter [Halopseudomonas salegens]